jgi:hypothetical protein
LFVWFVQISFILHSSLARPNEYGFFPFFPFYYTYTLTTADYTQNPFASTHSLDTNPFDDPVTPTSPSHAAEAARLEQLHQRERDLERREQELNAKADHIRRHGRNNWPPCLSHYTKPLLYILIFISPVLPLIFHSIQDEIPEASRPLITRLYQLWLVLSLTLIINMVACIFILLAGASDGGRDLGASIGSAGVFPSYHLLSFIFQLPLDYPCHVLPPMVSVRFPFLNSPRTNG